MKIRLSSRLFRVWWVRGKVGSDRRDIAVLWAALEWFIMTMNIM